MNFARILTSRFQPLIRQSSRNIARREGVSSNISGSNKLKIHSKVFNEDLHRQRPVHVRLYSQNEQTDSLPVSKRIENMVKNKKVVIFMKGIPDQPMCGFSNAVVQVLRMHGVDDYDAHNVLEDEELRQGIKDYSDWPTIPQVYFEGEFIGGCDILLQMHQSGDLIEELDKLGIKSALAK